MLIKEFVGQTSASIVLLTFLVLYQSILNVGIHSSSQEEF